MGNRPVRRRAKILLAIGAVLFTLGLLEAAGWLLHPLPEPPAARLHKYLPSWSAIGPAPRTVQFDPGPLAGVTPGLVQVAFNRWGFLYPEARHTRTQEDELRIAVVGGSTVECSALAPERRWPARLEQRLAKRTAPRPVTVLNLGISAQDTRTHLATTCHHIVHLDVDVVVFMLGANDLFRVGGEFTPMLGGDNFYPTPRWKLSRWLRRHTQIGRHIEHLQAGTRPRRTEPYFARQARYQAGLTVPDGELTIPPSGLTDYARNLTSLAGICKEHGIRVLFTTQPTMLTEDPEPEEKAVLWGFHANGRGVSPANFVHLLDSLNQTMRRVCADRGYACVDLAAEVPKGLGFFYDQVHFNEAGAERVAAALIDPVLGLVAGPR